MDHTYILALDTLVDRQSDLTIKFPHHPQNPQLKVGTYRTLFALNSQLNQYCRGSDPFFFEVKDIRLKYQKDQTFYLFWSTVEIRNINNCRIETFAREPTLIVKNGHGAYRGIVLLTHGMSLDLKSCKSVTDLLDDPWFLETEKIEEKPLQVKLIGLNESRELMENDGEPIMTQSTDIDNLILSVYSSSDSDDENHTNF